jgi:hypothetical protein
VSRAVIQIGDERVSFDGRNWAAVSGERAAMIARQMKIVEPLYRSRATSHPDPVYNIALVAAEEWHGQIVEYQPDPALAVPADADF